ncbi:MAG: hypothetical protein ACLUSP_09550 [Christensenellales bacterium]
METKCRPRTRASLLAGGGSPPWQSPGREDGGIVLDHQKILANGGSPQERKETNEIRRNITCSDFDRTFTDHTKNYAEGENVLAHVPEKPRGGKKIRDGGGVFAIVSGRNRRNFATRRLRAHRRSLRCEQRYGGLFDFEKRAVVSYTMDEDFLRTLRYLVSDGGMTFFRITDNDFRFAYWREGDDFDKAVSVAKFPVYKAIVENESEERIEKWRRELIGKFAGEYSIELSGSRTLEICPKGSGKAQALVKMRELLESRRGKKFDKLVCVGIIRTTSV